MLLECGGNQSIWRKRDHDQRKHQSFTLNQCTQYRLMRVKGEGQSSPAATGRSLLLADLRRVTECMNFDPSTDTEGSFSFSSVTASRADIFSTKGS